jgi:tetratricopeptide (TPR) repeat protein
VSEAEPQLSQAGGETAPVRAADARLAWLLPLGLVVITLITFSPALRAGFVNWDDDVNVEHNPAIRGLSAENLRWMVTTRLGGHFQPLTWLSLAIDYRIGGMRPVVFHLTNILLHALAVVLLYFVSLRVLRAAFAGATSPAAPPRDAALNWCAAFAAGVFAVHPLRVESVAWVTERRDVLSGVLLFATVLAYLRAVRGAKLSVAWWTVAIVLYALSLASKAIGMSLPIVLLILDVFPLRRLLDGRASLARRLVEKAPFFVLAFAAAFLAMRAQQAAGAWRSAAEMDWPMRAMAAAQGWWFYLLKLMRPTGLSPLYALPPRAVLLSSSGLFQAGAVVFVLAVALRHRRQYPAILAAVLAYSVMIAPVSGLAQSGKQLVADRYSYLALVPIALLAAGGLLRLNQLGRTQPERARTARVFEWFAGAYVIGVAMLTVAQCRVWENSITLWSQAVRVNPSDAVAFVNLGEALRLAHEVPTANDLESALHQFSRAVQLDGNDPKARNGLGLTLLQRGQPVLALEQLNRAVELDPRNARYRCNLGLTLAGFGRLAEAAAQYREALRLAPDLAHAAERLGAILVDLGQYEEAKSVMIDARARGVDDPALRGTLAWLLATCPQADIRDGRLAVDLAESLVAAAGHEDPWALDTLAAAYAEAGEFDKALPAAEQALRLAHEKQAPALARAVTERLDLYRENQPYREIPKSRAVPAAQP